MTVLEFAEKTAAVLEDAKTKLERHPGDDAVLLAVMTDTVDEMDKARGQVIGTRMVRYGYEELMAKRQAEEREGFIPAKE